MTKKKKEETYKLKAVKGKALPILCDGKILHIGDKEAVPVDLDKCSYETKAQISTAIKNKEITEEK